MALNQIYGLFNQRGQVFVPSLDKNPMLGYGIDTDNRDYHLCIDTDSPLPATYLTEIEKMLDEARLRKFYSEMPLEQLLDDLVEKRVFTRYRFVDRHNCGFDVIPGCAFSVMTHGTALWSFVSSNYDEVQLIGREGLRLLFADGSYIDLTDATPYGHNIYGKF